MDGFTRLDKRIDELELAVKSIDGMNTKLGPKGPTESNVYIDDLSLWVRYDNA